MSQMMWAIVGGLGCLLLLVIYLAAAGWWAMRQDQAAVRAYQDERQARRLDRNVPTGTRVRVTASGVYHGMVGTVAGRCSDSFDIRFDGLNYSIPFWAQELELEVAP